jgi:hypothetical protein
MRLVTRAGVPCLAASVAALAVTAPAAAAPKRITGKLSRPGYTVLALATTGKATVVRARRGTFKLTPPGRRVTLHLRAPSGKYAGPVVVGRRKRGKLAIVGVRAGARLGKVRVRSGYAMVAKRLRKRWVDAKGKARARKGIPIGAGNFGRVRSRPPRRAGAGDRDLDGVPGPLDIDDDGDLILDNLDRSNTARASQVNAEIGLIAVLNRPLYPPPNANAPGSTDPDIESGLQSSGQLIMRILPGGPVELDCGAPVPVGLRYCAPGGTGSLQPSGSSPRLEFPECCDGDGDGFGTLTRSPFGSGNQFVLDHGAPSTEIKSGRVLIEHVATGGDEGQCPPPPGPPSTSCASFPTALQYVLATVPGLKSYSDTASPTPNSATVYPVGGPTPGPGGPGTMGNGFPVRGSGPSGDGDVVLTLTFWRPQRRPIPPDPNTGLGGDACAKDDPPCKWIDIGGFTYVAIPGMLSKSQWPRPPSFCPQNSYTSSDLTPITIGPGLAGLTDTGTSDQPANPSNTVAYTLNVSQCLSSQGLTWPRDEELSLTFAAQAPGQPDNGTLVGVTFRRQ